MAEPKVCVSLEGISVDEMIDEATRANIAGADYVEVRFDKLYLIRPEPVITENDDGEKVSKIAPEKEWAVKDFKEIEIDVSISQLKEGIPVPVIFTVRPVREGGFFAGTEKQRLGIIEKAIDSNVSFIDLELSISDKDRTKLASKANESKCQIIASHHDATSTPSANEIVEIIRSNKEKGAIVKFCSAISNHQDSLQIIEAAHTLAEDESEHCLMGLGNGGDWVRLHAPILGQSLVYATMLNHFRLSDRGIINVRDLRDAWALLEY
jgi:3-dehydroquinate dehydratase-1